jgi:feruloyl esterase
MPVSAMKTLIPALIVLVHVPAAAQQTCANLTHLALPEITILSATPVPAGNFTLPGSAPNSAAAKVPAFCRIVGVVKPELQFELWLPAQWNGKYLAVGNGGMAGSIPLAAMVDPLNRGYATGGTDTGHVSANDDASWAQGHFERVINYAYRGIHLMAQADKAVIQAFYSKAPAQSYFDGCSYGGKQALTEAQRYPTDFNGIIAGDPANNAIRNYVGGHLFDALAMDGDGYIPAVKVPIIGKAVNEACDSLDGVKDGVLNDPRRCHFDPASLQCKSGDGPNCLTAAQVSAVKKVWGGLKSPDGKQIYPGIMPGGESDPGGWVRYMSGTGPGSGRHAALTNTFFRYIVFNDPAWDFHNFRFTAVPGFDDDLRVTDDKVGGLFNATNPDLWPFRASGGKLIHYHGWSDPDIPPLNSINYYQSVAAMKGLEDTAEFYRLFMVPGMQHCTGGPGTSRFDPITPLEQWVEHKKAPEQIPAAHLTAGKVDRTRPLCPFPQEATYKGTGNTDDAANFTCAVARE